MAAYLCLKSKTDGTIYGGSGLAKLDDMMCEALKVESDPVNFYRNWVDRMGFNIAVTSRPMSEALDFYVTEKDGYTPQPEDVAIVNWLLENFENASYSGR